MQWIESCSCPSCGDQMWECEHFVLDLGGGGEEGGVGLRAWGGLQIGIGGRAVVNAADYPL